jgi:hypothetical protein
MGGALSPCAIRRACDSGRLPAKAHELTQRVPETEHAWLAIDDREIDDAKRNLHRRQFIELIENDLGDRIALESITIRTFFCAELSRSVSSRISEMPSSRFSLSEIRNCSMSFDLLT